MVNKTHFESKSRAYDKKHSVFLPWVCGLGLIGPMIILPLHADASDWRSNLPFCNIQDCDTQVGDVKPPGHLRIFGAQATLPLTNTNIGRWHLVRTPAAENKETVSIMRTGELLDSDADFAGLMIKCRDNAGLQIAFVVVRPFPLRAHPQVTISTGHSSVHFNASVVPPGSVVSLPDEAEVLARGPWQSAKRLAVQIVGDGANIHGIVSLDNLSEAINLLEANCPAR
jgi:hypothetical protein